MKVKSLKLLLIASAILLMSGCFLEVITPKGGYVDSSSGTHDCAESTNCSIEVKDTNYKESFRAIPRDGYTFSHWNNGGGFICGGEKRPVCKIDTTVAKGNPGFEATVASSDTFYIMPVFTFVGIDTDKDGIPDHKDEDDDNDGIFDIDDTCPLDSNPRCGTGTPITDTVLIDGREWAQVDLFTNLSWGDISAVCSSGPCSGVLNDRNMAGWTWASSIDLGALLNSYAGDSVAVPEREYRYEEIDSTWAPALFNDGMRPTSMFQGTKIIGLTADAPYLNEKGGFPTWARAYVWKDRVPEGCCDSLTLELRALGFAQEDFGGWFYRDI